MVLGNHRTIADLDATLIQEALDHADLAARAANLFMVGSTRRTSATRGLRERGESLSPGSLR